MFTNANVKIMTTSLKPKVRLTHLSISMVAWLLCTPAQALLPTPLALVEEGGALADTSLVHTVVADDAKISDAKASDAKASDAKASDAQISKSEKVRNAHSTTAELLLATWRQQVQTQNLAQDKSWRRLLYILDDKDGLFNQTGDQSLIDSPSFFLADNGRQDAAAELDAMLVAIAQQIDNPTQDSVLCHFPARVNWLAEALNIDKQSIQADCPELEEWMTRLDPEQLSIMFAEEYLDNPISAFAHTLLRIDSKTSAADFNQINQAYAFNDTVDGDADDPFVLYAIKSINGRYNNIIEIDPYPQKLADYLKNDERDTWTYQLALTPNEVQQIIAHIWETKDLKLPYYFTTDNCASEILRLIDVVRPQQSLLSQLPYVVVPSDVVNLLNKEHLLASSRYTPSDSSVRQAQLNQVKAEQTKSAQAKLRNDSRRQIELSAKLGYGEIDKTDTQTIKSKMLNPASSLSAEAQTLLTLPIRAADNNPLDRHPMQRAQIGVGQRGGSNYIDVGLRAGFHDTLDYDSGYPQFFDLEGVKATLRFYNNDKDTNHKRVELQNLTLVRGRSFNPVNTAQSGSTWGASLEAKQVNDGSQQEGESHLVGSGRFEYGKSWAFGAPRSALGAPNDNISSEMPRQLCYALATGAVQGGRSISKGFRIGAGVNTGCRYQFNNQLRVQAELQLPYWYHGDSSQADVKTNYWQPISTVGVQYDIDKKQALRINANYDLQDRVKENDDIQLSYLRYF